MTRMWISGRGLLLCILISRTCAAPLQTSAVGGEDSDEADSEEEESTTAAPQRNVTDQQLSNQATQFLNQYFANYGTEAPLHIPTNLNHTIVITVLPNNSSGLIELANGAITEGPPQFVGDIPLFPSTFQEQTFFPEAQQQQELSFNSPLAPQPPAPPAALTPIENLVGFVPSKRVRPGNIRSNPSREAITASTAPTTSSTTTTTTTTEAPTTPAPEREEPVDNIEDAILEALSIAGGGSGQTSTPAPAPPSKPPQVNSNFQALVDSGVIPGISAESSNNNKQGGGVIKVPSNFGTVFIETEEQSTVASSGTLFLNKNSPAKEAVAAALEVEDPATLPPAALPPKIVVLQPYNPSATEEHNAVVEQQQEKIFGSVSGIIGSLSHGNLGGVVQNTIKLAETPVVQNAAKLATVTVLHNVLQGLNPCTYLGQNFPCPPRPQQQQGKK